MRPGKLNTAIPCFWIVVSFSSVGQDGLAADVQFNRDIRPILSAKCFVCHGPDGNAREADLRLDEKSGLLGRLAEGGRTVAPGDPQASGLFLRITAENPEDRMPPADSGKTLTNTEIERIRQWIEQGANWQGHWAFQPPESGPLPTTSRPAWANNAVDRLILSRLDQEGIKPSPPADRTTLIRRLSFDLRGLPPELAEVNQFLADDAPQAYERLVDRLLNSPHYGEKMAMHWLDLVRYADSGGYHSDVAHSISPYRDYVINAFNDNMPFDQFTREQIAGDLLPNPTVEQLVATGYNRLNKTTEEGGAQPDEYLAKYAADRVRTTAGVWLGATLGCAECHDHKYDPYTTKDFYSFAAFFADVKEIGKYSGGKREPELLVPSRAQAAEMADIAAELADLQTKLKPADPALQLSPQELKALETRQEELTRKQQELEKQFTRTMITVAVEPREMRVLPRGNWLDHSGEVVTAALPEFLSPDANNPRRLTRLDLANWIVSRDNPLTSRVFVNRLWAQFFGTGLSKKLDDVGIQGEWPTHPELLDWLAVEFVDSGWDIKHFVKLLVMSNCYQQTSLPREDLSERDPQNRLYARQSRWRLNAEMIRDNALAVSGLLVRDIGGKSVKPYQPTGYWSHLNFPKRKWQPDQGADQYRRGIYTHWQRTFLHPSLLAFDAPSREECTAERTVSNTPKAALTLLNDPTYVEAARVLAARTILEGGENDKQRINWVWQQTLSRQPSDREVDVLAQLLNNQAAYYRTHADDAKKLLGVGLAAVSAEADAVETAAWTAVTRALLNLNESITRN